MAKNEVEITVPDKNTYKKAVLTMTIAAACSGVWQLPIMGHFLTGFIQSMGGEERAVSIISNLVAYTSIFVFLGAFFSAKYGKRLTFVLFGGLRWVAWVLVLFVPALPKNMQLYSLGALILLYGIILHIGVPSWYSLLSSCVPARNRGKYLGKRFLISSLVGIGAFYLLSKIVLAFGKNDPRGYQIIIGIAIVFGLVGIFAHLLLPKFKTDEEEKKESFTTNFKESFKIILKSRDIKRFCLMMFLLHIYIGAISPYFSMYLLKEKYLDYDFDTISYFNITVFSAALLGYWIFGKICDKFGNKTVLISVFFVRIFQTLTFYFLTKEGYTLAGIPITYKLTTGIMYFNNFAGSFLWTGITLATSNMIMALSPKKRNEGVIAGMIFIFMLGMVVAPFIANAIFGWAPNAVGWLTSATGLPFDEIKVVFLFLHVLLILMTIVTFFIHIPHEKHAGPVLRQLMLPGGLRSMRIVMFDKSEKSSRDKIKTVEKLQKQKHPFAIENLIPHLEDPSIRVRMQAAWALGSIKDDSAIEALEDKVLDPHSHIQLDAIRALGKIADPSSLSVLIESLKSENNLLRGEAALALGDFKVQEAWDALLESGKQEKDKYVTECIYDALSNFHDDTLMPSLINDLSSSDNKLTRRHLAMVAGRYVEKKWEEFYKMLSKELDEEGSGGSKGIDNILRIVKRIELTNTEKHDLIHQVDSIGTLFWDKDYSEVVSRILDLYSRHKDKYSDLSGKSRPIEVLDVIRKCDCLAECNQELALLTIYAFYQLVEKSGKHRPGDQGFYS